MALAWTSITCSYSLTSGSYILLALLLLGLNSEICHGLGSFGFDIHHRFSDSVMQILDRCGVVGTVGRHGFVLAWVAIGGWFSSSWGRGPPWVDRFPIAFSSADFPVNPFETDRFQSLTFHFRRLSANCS
nr:hypothetical protein CFP56_23761 [Quercus suber]